MDQVDSKSMQSTVQSFVLQKNKQLWKRAAEIRFVIRGTKTIKAEHSPTFERASQSRECSAFSALLSLDDEA